MKLFRLQVFFKGSWRWGINEYDSEEKAAERVKELAKVGIKARIGKNAELFA